MCLWVLLLQVLAIAQCRNRSYIMCEFVDLRGHMKGFEKGLSEIQHKVTKETLMWSDWHSIRENNLQIKAQERGRLRVEMALQTQALRDTEKAIKNHMHALNIRYLALERCLDAMVAKVDSMERVLSAPREGTQHSPPCPAASSSSSRESAILHESQVSKGILYGPAF